jgi:hypothetical protein
MEITPTKRNQKSGPDFWLNTWIGRVLLVAGAVQAAIIVASFTKVAPTLHISDLTNLNSITGLFLGVAMMAFSHPFSLFFFTEGLSYFVGLYFYPADLATNSAFWQHQLFFMPLFVYSGITISAALIRKRAILIIIYLVLTVTLVANVAGCAAMPLPGPM